MIENPASRNPQRPTPGAPWTTRQRLRLLLWDVCWTLFCQWTPKPWNAWRLLLLRIFGARISGRPFVHQRARIPVPWNISLENKACVGDRAHLYSLAPIHLGAHCIVAQEAYLCTGSHAFEPPRFPLVVAPIRIGDGAFVGARAFILPGITVGAGAVVGAMSVVTAPVAEGCRVAGNPARPLSSSTLG